MSALAGVALEVISLLPPVLPLVQEASFRLLEVLARKAALSRQLVIRFVSAVVIARMLDQLEVMCASLVGVVRVGMLP